MNQEWNVRLYVNTKATKAALIAALVAFIYTNPIKSYHRQLRKVTKGKSIFPTDEALPKMLYLATMDVTMKGTDRVRNWRQILLHGLMNI
ncbi:hypothetical protein SAMN05421868_105201 [Paenibacillus naphthalenovorans]|nr:hypothetical protein SAMN05421868_105201 [Paenibacillus naphthalenovorans]